MGTNYIAPTWRQPENTNKDKLSNYSIDFGTTADVISTNTTWQTDVGLNDVKKLSFSIWVKPDSGTGSNIMAATSQAYGSWNGNFNITYKADVTKLALEFRSVGDVFVNNNTTLTGDTWHHICFVIDLTLNGTIAQEVKCFLNNSEVANQSSATPPVNFVLKTTSFNIGRTLWGSGSSGYQWNGAIAQACFFDYPLSIDQRTYLYNLNNPMAISGAEPVAYWPLGDNSNPTATAGYPNISVGADSVFDFNGATGVIPLPQGSLQLVTSISISAWIKTTTTGTRQTIISNDNVSSNSNNGGRSWNFLVNGQNIDFTVRPENDPVAAGTTYSNITTSGVNVSDDNWHSVVALWDGTTNTNSQKVFVDGILRAQGTPSFTQPIRQHESNKPTIGDQAGQTQFWDWEGEMSNIQIWESALTYGTVSSLGDAAGGEVAQLYNHGVPLMTGTQPQSANLKGWWKLDQTANWEADSTGNWQIPDALSSYPQSFDFNNTTDAINVGGISLGTVHTINFWVNFKPPYGTRAAYILSSGSENGWVVYANNGGTLYYKAGSSQYYSGTMTAPTAAGVGKWHNITITRNGAEINFYQNGNTTPFANTSAFAGASTPLGDIDFISGDRSYGSSIRYSNFTFYDIEFSPSQVSQIYNNGVPLTSAIATSNLKAWYKLDNTAIFYETQQYWGIPNAASTSDLINFSN